MTSITLPTYAAIRQAMNSTTRKLHPSQVHGVISGILCGQSGHQAAWETVVTGGKESVKAHEILQKLYTLSEKQLDEFLFEFQLILPLDSDPLPDRAEALTLWCQGFLTGLKLIKIAIIGREQSDMTEAINDLIEIAKMNYEDVVANEEDETAYVELVEYVRMAVILIYQDSRAAEDVKQTSAISSQMH